ncbi:unknown [Clostridium sp. CAG:448]|nr:unknown [Clostridium sp. CAG:448]
MVFPSSKIAGIDSVQIGFVIDRFTEHFSRQGQHLRNICGGAGNVQNQRRAAFVRPDCAHSVVKIDFTTKLLLLCPQLFRCVTGGSQGGKRQSQTENIAKLFFRQITQVKGETDPTQFPGVGCDGKKRNRIFAGAD